MKIICGDSLTELKKLESESVHCCVTSPPYWNLRDYGVKGQLGLEATPEEYVKNQVEVFREVRRILRNDGTLWLVIGDSYSHGGNGSRDPARWPKQSRNDHRVKHKKKKSGVKPKDLIGIPWMIAFALRSDGWWLRAENIWHKPNSMPESVQDRTTICHEHIFLFAKSHKYYYNREAILEDLQSGPSDLKKMREGKDRIGGKNKGLDDKFNKASKHTNMGQKRAVGGIRKSGNKKRFIPKKGERGRLNDHRGIGIPWEDEGIGRNKRSVWTVSVVPYRGAHFATYPPKLIEPCILAGSPEDGLYLTRLLDQEQQVWLLRVLAGVGLSVSI